MVSTYGKSVLKMSKATIRRTREKERHEKIRQNQRAVQQPGAQRGGFFVFSLVAVLANDFYKRIVSQYSPPDAE